MKKIILISTILGFSVLASAADIVLGPGSTATITASETTSVTCSGQLPTGGSGDCNCVIGSSPWGPIFIVKYKDGSDLYSSGDYSNKETAIAECKNKVKSMAACQP